MSWGVGAQIVLKKMGVGLKVCVCVCVCVCVWEGGGREYGGGGLVADFRWYSTLGQNGFKKIKLITINIGFCTLFTSVIVKVLFKLMQQVVLREYS